MDKQRQDRQQEEQYNNIAGLGWKKFGIAILVIVIVVIILLAMAFFIKAS